MLRGAFGLLFFTMAWPAGAEQSVIEEIGRWIELPQHKRLMKVAQNPSVTPNAFTTDGCSGGMSAAWQPVAQVIPGFTEAYVAAPPWETCCVTHDRAYHSADRKTSENESFEARLQADETLLQCVLQDGQDRREEIATELMTRPEVVDQAYDLIANGMFQAVRLGGGPCSGLPWRWGYGYPSCIWN